MQDLEENLTSLNAYIGENQWPKIIPLKKLQKEKQIKSK